MYVTLSVATSHDHCIDDMTPQRLILSTPEDWAEVYRLRGESDAILVGGETLRRDNPSLGLKGYRSGRALPLRVVVSGRGEISAESKIFHREGGRVVIFSHVERPELSGLAEVVVSEVIDPAQIITELEKRGVGRLFVEGGAQILRQFVASNLVDEIRLALNPAVVVNDPLAPRFEHPMEGASVQNLGGMIVSTLVVRGGGADSADRELMRRAVEVSRNSPPKGSCYRVGAVIRSASGETFEGYTLETSPTHHAEQAAMQKALAAGVELRGATIYSSIEPCSTRSSEPESCSELILRHGFSRVLFALYEPSHFVECHGAENLRRAGVEVLHLALFEQEVRQINGHLPMISIEG